MKLSKNFVSRLSDSVIFNTVVTHYYTTPNCAYISLTIYCTYLHCALTLGDLVVFCSLSTRFSYASFPCYIAVLTLNLQISDVIRNAVTKLKKERISVFSTENEYRSLQRIYGICDHAIFKLLFRCIVIFINFIRWYQLLCSRMTKMRASSFATNSSIFFFTRYLLWIAIWSIIIF